MRTKTMNILREAFEATSTYPDDKPLYTGNHWEVAFKRASVLGKIRMLLEKHLDKLKNKNNGRL